MLKFLVLLQSTPKDKKGEIDINPQSIIEKLDTWLDGFIRALPNIVIGIIVFVVMYKTSVFCFVFLCVGGFSDFVGAPGDSQKRENK